MLAQYCIKCSYRAKLKGIEWSLPLEVSDSDLQRLLFPEKQSVNSRIIQLAVDKYIKYKHNVIIMGASGAGKTFIGCALGVSACRQLVTVKYVRLTDLLTDLAIARGDGLYKKVIEHYKKYQLLIFDEWQLTPLPSLLCIINLSKKYTGSLYDDYDKDYYKFTVTEVDVYHISF